MAASLVVSLPSAVLAAMDIADRIKKRRRTTELIEEARALLATGVQIHVHDGSKLITVATAESDELLAAAEAVP